MLYSRNGLALAAILLASTSALAVTEAKEEYQEFEQMELIPFVASDSLGAAREAHGPTNATVLKSFQGISQYDVASYGRNFIPPDTMGAVGKTQYTSFLNGGFAVFNKSDGSVAKASSDLAFWSAAGQTGANGDSRVMYDKSSQRWIALAFGASVSDIQIAVSDTSDATGGWKSTKFTGFAGGTADYPTLALDTQAAYIGTNNFNAAGRFSGTTLNVIPLSSLLANGGPTLTDKVAFVTPYNAATGGADGGFAIQGVNSRMASTTGHVIAASLFFNDVIRFDVADTGTAAATKGPVTYIGTADYASNGAGRQPNAIPDVDINLADSIFSNDRVVDTLDNRISSSAYEVNGRIYTVYTATPIGSSYTHVRYDVVDAATNQLLDEGDIGDGMHDYYQGSLAVNKDGQVVIGYNRSGSGADGLITFAARTFKTRANGKLTEIGTEQILKVSLVDDYHNGSLDGQVAVGRQRWGDYSAVSLDPENERHFWLIGQYAREYNNAAGGHPGGTGGSRWSTWISELGLGAVPEPSSWLTMLAGFGALGAALRRQRKLARTGA